MSSYWLGVTDMSTEGIWRFKSDNVAVYNYSNIYNNIGIKWYTSRPMSSTSYQCLYWSYSDNAFFDGGCSWSYYQFCEHPRMSFSYAFIRSPLSIYIYIYIYLYLYLSISISISI